MRLKQAGFNLVELSVVLVISSVLMLSLTNVFVDAKVSSYKSTVTANLQQQAQLALQVLLEDVRNIGSWATFSGEPLSAISIPASMTVKGCNITTGASVDKPHLPNTANWINSASAAPNISGCLDTDYRLSTTSDILSLARVQGALIAGVESASLGNLTADDYYIAASPQAATLFLGSNLAQVKSMDNADIFPYLRRAYLVEVTGDNNIPRLMRFSLNNGQFSNDMIIANIERFRIDFGIDTNFDGQINSYNSSPSVTAAMWTNNQILAARIYVLARADSPDFTFNNSGTYNDRYAPFDVSEGDHYRRFILSTTVNINNNHMVDLQ